MTVTSVRTDPDTLTLTLTAEFEASPERVWNLWSDPRKLERWWGPPTYPATFTGRTTTLRKNNSWIRCFPFDLCPSLPHFR